MKTNDIEGIDKLLNYHTILIKEQDDNIGGELFNRNRFFTIKGNQYRIEWYINQSYLHCPGDITVPFTSMARKNTWPHTSKMNLQFYNEHHDVCCVLKIE